MSNEVSAEIKEMLLRSSFEDSDPRLVSAFIALEKVVCDLKLRVEKLEEVAK